MGVIYAGLMLTADGPRLVEYNVRFGDPETQAVLPLVESDLAALMLACTRGPALASTDGGEAAIAVRDGASLTVVAAAAGYPDAPTSGAGITDSGTDSADGDPLRCGRRRRREPSPAAACSP